MAVKQLNRPSHELASHFVECGLLELSLAEIEKDILENPDLYYPDHLQMRRRKGKNPIPYRWWIEGCK